MTKRLSELEEAKRLLEQHGYDVKRSRSSLVKTTVELDPDLVADVHRLRQEANLSFRQVVEQALRGWVNTQAK